MKKSLFSSKDQVAIVHLLMHQKMILPTGLKCSNEIIEKVRNLNTQNNN